MGKQIRSVDVAIIGAGFGGLGVGIALLKNNIDDFVIFEGEAGVGGSWRTNTYPGCACDVPSHLYSYSFEPNPHWPEAFSQQKDIQNYIEHCADKYQLRPKIRFSTKVTNAQFDDRKGMWRITTNDGTITEARVLVPATGSLSLPKYPDIKNRTQFKGIAMHAARWDSSIDLKNKRVGVIGTGASAIQIIPAIAPEVGTLNVFQRTPAWVLPKGNRRYSKVEHAQWAKSPWRQRAKRLMTYTIMECALPALMWYPKLLRLGEFLHKKSLRKAIKDPALRTKLTPAYKVGCKRTLISDDYFSTFNRDNVHLVTDDIQEITPTGIRTTDGEEHELDILVYASGYDIGSPAFPYEITGLNGTNLNDYWGIQPKAYYGMNVSHFPNMLIIMGPNTGPGHTSVLVYQEAQYEYVAKYTKHLLNKRIRYLDLKETVQNDQFQWFQDRMKNSSWLSGCTSWYLNEDGTNSAIWPGFSFEYVIRTKSLRRDVYNEV